MIEARGDLIKYHRTVVRTICQKGDWMFLLLQYEGLHLGQSYLWSEQERQNKSIKTMSKVWEDRTSCSNNETTSLANSADMEETTDISLCLSFQTLCAASPIRPWHQRRIFLSFHAVCSTYRSVFSIPSATLSSDTLVFFLNVSFIWLFQFHIARRGMSLFILFFSPSNGSPLCLALLLFSLSVRAFIWILSSTLFPEPMLIFLDLVLHSNPP